MTTGQQTTGISDTVYDLGSVFYHAAEGGQVYSKYIGDAEKDGDQELVEFFARSEIRTPRGLRRPRAC